MDPIPLGSGWIDAAAWQPGGLPGQLITLNFAPILSGAATRALVAIKLIESPLTNDLRQFQKIAGGAPLAMVAVAIDRISPDLGSLCHYEIKLPLRQLIKLLKLNRAVKQVAFKPLWVEFLRRDIQV